MWEHIAVCQCINNLNFKNKILDLKMFFKVDFKNILKTGFKKYF